MKSVVFILLATLLACSALEQSSSVAASVEAPTLTVNDKGQLSADDVKNFISALSPEQRKSFQQQVSTELGAKDDKKTDASKDKKTDKKDDTMTALKKLVKKSEAELGRVQPTKAKTSVDGLLDEERNDFTFTPLFDGVSPRRLHPAAGPMNALSAGGLAPVPGFNPYTGYAPYPVYGGYPQAYGGFQPYAGYAPYLYGNYAAYGAGYPFQQMPFAFDPLPRSRRRSSKLRRLVKPRISTSKKSSSSASIFSDRAEGLGDLTPFPDYVEPSMIPRRFRQMREL